MDMNTVSYLAVFIAGLLMAAWLFHENLARAREKRSLAWLTLLLGTGLGWLLAKGVYVVSRAKEVFTLYGFEALLRLNPEEFSFVGGCAGFVAGCVLASLILRVKIRRGLDLMAAPLALGVAFARAAESFLGQLGLGEDLTDVEWTHFFPMTTETRYSEWYSEWSLSVNLQLALLALVCVMLAVHWLRTCGDVPGVCFERTVVMLCAPLFILELMRSVSMTILVRVHLEQILIMLAMSVCIILAAVRGRRSWAGILIPAILLLLIVGLNIVLQFGIDGKLNPLLEKLPFSEEALDWILWEHRADWCYPGMILTDIGMVVMELVLTRRQMRKTRRALQAGG